MIYNYTSVKKVIAKVFTDLDLQEDTHRISDMIEWAGEALEKIGAFPQFVNRVTGKDSIPITELVNYQAQLPFDFHRLVQVVYSSSEDGPFYPMRSATGKFDVGENNTDSSSSDLEDVAATSDIVTLAMSLYDLTYSEALERVNTEAGTRALLSSILTSTQSAGVSETTTDYVYIINDNWIKTNVENGYLMIAYQAIPTDAEGYPLVPNDQSFIDALYWYITMKLLYPKWMAGQIRDAIYYDARRSWNYYCKQAYGNAMLPNPDQMESIKNTWLRLVPEITEHSSAFSFAGQRQVVYNANE